MNLRNLMAASAAALACSACNTVPGVEPLRSACSTLSAQTIAAAAIGLPSGPATVAFGRAGAGSAGVRQRQRAHAGDTGVLQGAGQRGPARSEGAAASTSSSTCRPQWNGKALQYGGGGFNGVLITGLAPLRDAAPGDPLPIARGYATFGTDSGHQASASPPSEPGAFALNDEMLENFAYASYKKVKDVAVDLDARVLRPARRASVYYFGGSEGGREGLTMAQRFPADYDGIVSVVPVINWTGLFHAFVRNEVPQFGDWLDAAKAPLIAKATSDACDALDGLADGVVNNYLACQGRVNLQALRCPGGSDAGAHCLSDAELALMRSIHSPYTVLVPAGQRHHHRIRRGSTATRTASMARRR